MRKRWRKEKLLTVGKEEVSDMACLTRNFILNRRPKWLLLFKDLPEALDNTNLIVDKIEQFKLGREVLLPKFEIADDFIATNVEAIDASFARIVALKEKDWDGKNLSEANS